MKNQSWDSYEKSLEKGPFSFVVKIVVGIFALSILVGGVGYVLGWFSEAGVVAKEEFGPRAMLKKYEWFKDASASLDKKQADIVVFKARVKRIEARHDNEALTQAETELIGVISSYNELAANYNSQMAKFNWRFANKGTLPAGADKELPREYKPYVESIDYE